MPKLPPQKTDAAGEQTPPFCIQVELTEGCNLRCSFCGLNGIRGKDNNFKFMSPEFAEHLAEMIGEAEWNSRIEFAMHGEPSANPDMLEILRVFRKHLPRHHLMMTSNGYGFMRDPNTTVDSALESLNVLALDWYENVKIVPKILERYSGEHTVRRYPQDKDANPHKRRKPKERVFVIVQDIDAATSGNHATLNNHCGAGSPPNDRAEGKRCAKPFREMSVRWDGSIAVCCNDWRGHYKCGNLNESSLQQVWNGPAFIAARRKLYHGQRDFGPCAGCDALSYRPGLLPDKQGKLVLLPPQPSDTKAIARALAGQPLTTPVLRPWELPVLG